ncbi:hypothetical protein [Cellulomonas sp. HZM]|uniref:hypothetical protein n=1 Tax=Cellulomonas sp. HZM TaxID=1454010 RepID=UPI0018CC0CB7|nr:hypothetical protein [Cellulomonas sp. HZM]
MNCFDCLTSLQTESPASAVCSSCGAALCVVHALVGVPRQEVHSVGSPSATVLPGRRVWCSACAPSGAAPLAVRTRSHKVATA